MQIGKLIRKVLHSSNKKKVIFFTLLLLFIISFLLRIRLGTVAELWLDESFSYDISHNTPFLDLFLQNKTYWDFVHPAGYYLLLKTWLLVAPHTEIAIRFPSILFASLGVLIMYYIAKSLEFSAKEALLPSFLYAIHPELVSVTYQARMYGISIFLIMVGFYFLVNKGNGFKNAFWAGLFFGITTYFSYMTIWLIPSFIFLICLGYLRDSSDWKKLSKILLIFFLVSSPQFIILVSRFLNYPLIPGSVPQGEDFNLAIIIFTLQKLFSINFDTIFSGIIAIGLFFLVFNCRENLMSLYVKSFIFVPILSSLLISFIMYPIFLDRNVLFVLIFFLIFISKQFFISLKEKKYYAVLLIFVLVCMWLYNLTKNHYFFDQTYYGYAASQIAKSGKKILFLDYYYVTEVSGYYFKKHNVNPNFSIINNHFNLNNILTQSITNTIVIYGTKCEENNSCLLVIQNIKKDCFDCTYISQDDFLDYEKLEQTFVDTSN